MFFIKKIFIVIISYDGLRNGDTKIDVLKISMIDDSKSLYLKIYIQSYLYLKIGLPPVLKARSSGKCFPSSYNSQREKKRSPNFSNFD
jgi:hypothetical protein